MLPEYSVRGKKIVCFQILTYTKYCSIYISMLHKQRIVRVAANTDLWSICTFLENNQVFGEGHAVCVPLLCLDWLQ